MLYISYPRELQDIILYYLARDSKPFKLIQILSAVSNYGMRRELHKRIYEMACKSTPRYNIITENVSIIHDIYLLYFKTYNNTHYDEDDKKYNDIITNFKHELKKEHIAFTDIIIPSPIFNPYSRNGEESKFVQSIESFQGCNYPIPFHWRYECNCGSNVCCKYSNIINAKQYIMMMPVAFKSIISFKHSRYNKHSLISILTGKYINTLTNILNVMSHCHMASMNKYDMIEKIRIAFFSICSINIDSCMY